MKAGDPDASFLVQKLEGHLAADEGDAMPQLGPPLPTGTIGLVRAWIEQGARAE